MWCDVNEWKNCGRESGGKSMSVSSSAKLCSLCGRVCDSVIV
jgi:hypothetical protein